MNEMEDQEALDLAADWSDISQGLRKDLGQQLHSQWIRPIQLGTFCKETGTLDLFLPTEFSANWVTDRFADRLSLLFGTNGSRTITRLSAFLLFCIGVQILITGASDALTPILAGH